MLDITKVMAGVVRKLDDTDLVAMVYGDANESVMTKVYAAIGVAFINGEKLTGTTNVKKVTGTVARAVPSARTKTKVKAAKRSSFKAKGKRTANELDQLIASVASHIASNPGQGVEQIAKGMAVSSKELAGPIKALVKTGRLSTTGAKRGTRYYDAGRVSNGAAAHAN